MCTPHSNELIKDTTLGRFLKCGLQDNANYLFGRVTNMHIKHTHKHTSTHTYNWNVMAKVIITDCKRTWIILEWVIIPCFTSWNGFARVFETRGSFCYMCSLYTQNMVLKYTIPYNINIACVSCLILCCFRFERFHKEWKENYSEFVQTRTSSGSISAWYDRAYTNKTHSAYYLIDTSVCVCIFLPWLSVFVYIYMCV